MSYTYNYSLNELSSKSFISYFKSYAAFFWIVAIIGIIANWKLFKKGVEPSFLNFPTNGAGTLFFPNSLSKDFFNQDLFTKLSPLGDDIWVWAMAVRNNTKIKVVNNPIHDLTYINPAREFNLLDESTLWSVNYIYNDFQINSVLNYFPEILKKIFHKK